MNEHTVLLPREHPYARMPDRACAGRDVNLFFYDGKGDDPTPVAKAICRSCPYAAGCLRWALDNREDHGVYGATSPADRDAIRRRVAEQYADVADGRMSLNAAYESVRRGKGAA